MCAGSDDGSDQQPHRRGLNGRAGLGCLVQEKQRRGLARGPERPAHAGAQGQRAGRRRLGLGDHPGRAARAHRARRGHQAEPRALARARGDRLVFSNGVLILAVMASVLLVVFQGDVSKLIPLYAVGVFTSFTLSQTGMVRHHLKEKAKGWRLSMAFSLIGAIATGLRVARNRSAR